jgi:farnesyl diphosphate synthase
MMGAACGSASVATLAALDGYGAAIGLAFQVVDDILDVTQESVTLGKTAGKDQQDNKPTYVTVLGLEAAKQLARDLRLQALQALSESLLPDPARLSLLADMVVERDS